MNIQSTLLQLNIPDFTIQKVEENEKWGHSISRYTVYAQYKKENCYTRLVVQLRLDNHQWEQIQLEAAGVSEKVDGFYFPCLLYSSSSREYESYILRKAVYGLEEAFRDHPHIRLPLLMNEYELVIEERTLKGMNELEANIPTSFMKNLTEVWVSFGIILIASILAYFFPKQIAYGFVILSSLGGVFWILGTIVMNIREIRHEWKIRRERKIISIEKKVKK